MESESLVDFYRRKILERYTACINRDTHQKIADLLRSADEETLAAIVRLLESKK